MQGVNATMIRFGHPGTLVADYGRWAVLLRRHQPTLGSLILICKEEVTAFADIGAPAFVELERAVADIEAALARAFHYQKINYLMLMMVDPHVHFHVLPRYEQPCSFGNLTITDAGWPKAPDLGSGVQLRDDQAEELIAYLKTCWKGA